MLEPPLDKSEASIVKDKTASTPRMTAIIAARKKPQPKPIIKLVIRQEKFTSIPDGVRDLGSNLVHSGRSKLIVSYSIQFLNDLHPFSGN